MIPEELRPVISRLIASFVPALLLWLGKKLGVAIPQETVNVAVEAIPLLAIYSLSHRAVDRKVNPGDAASPKMAESDKALNKTL